MALPGAAKELQPLVKAAKDNGYKVVPSGKGGHYKVQNTKTGQWVVDEHGPVIFSSTPGDFRARDMHVKRLIAAKVIKADPWKPDAGEKKQNRKNRINDPDVQAKKVEAIKQQSRDRAERTRKIRSRLEPIVVKMGGWEKSGLGAELGRIYFHYLTSRNRVEKPPSISAAQQTIVGIKKGNTLGDKNMDGLELLLDHLERSTRGPNGQVDPEKLRKVWFDLDREAKGLATESAHPAEETQANGSQAAAPPPRPAPVIPAKAEERLGPLYNGRMPKIALEAVAMMTAGRHNPDLQEIVRVGEEILKLELDAANH